MPVVSINYIGPKAYKRSGSAESLKLRPRIRPHGDDKKTCGQMVALLGMTSLETSGPKARVGIGPLEAADRKGFCMIPQQKRKRMIRRERDPASAEARDVRLLARLRDIRRQIEAGTYLTDAKLDLVVDCLCEILNQGGKHVRRASA